MEIEGKIIKEYAVESGINSNGKEWVKKGYVLEVPDEKYPYEVKFDVYGSDRIEQVKASIGDEVIISVDVKSREFPEGSGKWYTDVRAWKIVKKNQPEAVPAAQAAVPDPFAPDGGKLPF